jgi:hypothetical protein
LGLKKEGILMKIKVFVNNDKVTGYSMGGTHSENDLNIQYEVQPQEGQSVRELEVEDDLLASQKPEEILESLQKRMKT